MTLVEISYSRGSAQDSAWSRSYRQAGNGREGRRKGLHAKRRRHSCRRLTVPLYCQADVEIVHSVTADKEGMGESRSLVGELLDAIVEAGIISSHVLIFGETMGRLFGTTLHVHLLSRNPNPHRPPCAQSITLRQSCYIHHDPISDHHQGTAGLIVIASTTDRAFTLYGPCAETICEPLGSKGCGFRQAHRLLHHHHSPRCCAPRSRSSRRASSREVSASSSGFRISVSHSRWCATITLSDGPCCSVESGGCQRRCRTSPSL
jgi:hypothetical protein